MSNQILSEVWDHVSKLNNAAKLVLLRMADKAADEHRMYWEALDTIATRTGIGISSVKRALNELYALNILEDVPDDQRPAKAQGLPSACRRILPAEVWGTEPTPDGGPTMGLPQEPEIATKRGEGGPTMGHKTNNNLSTYGRESYNPSGYNRRAAARRSVKPTRRQAEENRRAADDDLDPAKSPEVLELFPVSETAGVDSVGNRSARPRERRSRTNSPDSSMGLALAFRGAQVASDWRAVDMASLKPLAAHFARWKAQGISPDTIRKMIDIYAGDERIRDASKAKAPWLDFVGKKHLLLNQAERSVTAAQSADVWDRLAAAQESDPDNQDMWYVPGQTAEGVDN